MFVQSMNSKLQSCYCGVGEVWFAGSLHVSCVSKSLMLWADLDASVFPNTHHQGLSSPPVVETCEQLHYFKGTLWFQ